jgi:ATP synthase protein I
MRAVGLILAAQAGVTGAAALLAWFISGDPRGAWSALIGGAIGFSTAAVYARGMFAAGGREPRELVTAHFRAEVFKLALTVVLFAAAFILYKEVSTLALLLTYIATLTVYWIALLFA